MQPCIGVPSGKKYCVEAQAVEQFFHQFREKGHLKPKYCESPPIFQVLSLIDAGGVQPFFFSFKYCSIQNYVDMLGKSVTLSNPICSIIEKISFYFSETWH